MAKEQTHDGLLWDHPRHRAAKHAILERCLEAWLSSLDDADREVTFVDGSAGPDEYEGGEPGSPIVALNVADEQQAILAHRAMRFIFVEEDDVRAERLERTLNAREIPANIETVVVPGAFEEAMGRLLEALGDAEMGRTLVMVDPFGVAGVPFHVMKQLAKQPRCDLLVTCMPETLSRWTETNEQEGGHVDRMFGGPNWRPFSLEGQVDFYRDNLQAAGFTHTRRLTLIDQRTKSTYYLIIATHAAESAAATAAAFAVVDGSARQAFTTEAPPTG